MDLGNPFSVLTPSLDAPVLQVLARTTDAMTAPQIHRIMARASYNGVVKVLIRLTQHGIVLESRVGATRLFRGNRHHLAWPAVEILATLRDGLESRVRSSLAGWHLQPEAAVLFGSAARRDGDLGSDIDILLVAPLGITAEGLSSVDADTWDEQKLTLAADIRSWSGNPASILEVSIVEFSRMIERAEPIIGELRRDGVPLFGLPIRQLLGEIR